MDRIDFDATMDSGGIIHVPNEYVKKLATNERVHVTLSGKQSERASVKMMREEALDAEEPVPLTRDELYDRA